MLMLSVVAITALIGTISPPDTSDDPASGGIVVQVQLDAGRQADLDPNYIAIVARVTDADTGASVEREYALRATARSGAMVDATVFHLGYPYRENPAAAQPGRYPGVVIVPAGGTWTISVTAYDRVAAEIDTIPEPLAFGEVTVDVDAALLPAAAADARVDVAGVSGSELILRIVHSVVGLAWFLIAAALTTIGQSRVLLRSGAIGDVVERNLSRLVLALTWCTGLVWLTGALSLKEATAFSPPLSPSQVEALFRVPYARAYTITLAVKVAVSLALSVTAIPLIKRARRTVSRRAEPAGAPLMPLVVAVGGAVVLICVSVLTYVHTVAERGV